MLDKEVHVFFSGAILILVKSMCCGLGITASRANDNTTRYLSLECRLHNLADFARGVVRLECCREVKPCLGLKGRLRLHIAQVM